MQRFWEVAPPETWLILGASSILLLAGFVLLSHTLVRENAHGDRYEGLTHRGRLEWTLRVGGGCLLTGLVLWGIELEAPPSLLVGLGALALLAFSLEAVARLRG